MAKKDKELNALEGMLSKNLSKRSKPSPLGWKNVPLSTLQYEGKYYPEGTKIEIAAMTAKTLKWIGGIDLNDPVQLARMWNYVVSEHSRIIVNGSRKPIKGSHVFGFDRSRLLLMIRELNEFGNTLQFKTKCTHKGCGSTQMNPFTPNMTSVTKDSLSKYWDGLIFTIPQNDSFETTWYYSPPTIAEVNEASELIIPKVRSGDLSVEETTFFANVFAFLRAYPNKENESLNTMKNYYRKFKLLNAREIEELNFLKKHVLDGTEEGTVECNACFQKYSARAFPTDWSDFAKSERVFEL